MWYGFDSGGFLGAIPWPSLNGQPGPCCRRKGRRLSCRPLDPSPSCTVMRHMFVHVFQVWAPDVQPNIRVLGHASPSPGPFGPKAAEVSRVGLHSTCIPSARPRKLVAQRVHSSKFMSGYDVIQRVFMKFGGLKEANNLKSRGKEEGRVKTFKCKRMRVCWHEAEAEGQP